VEDLPAALARPLLPPEAEVTGLLDGRLEASAGPAGALDADGVFTLGPGRLAYAAEGGRIEVPYRGRIEATSGADGLRAGLDLDLGETGSVAGEARVADVRLGEPPGDEELSGRIEVDLEELAFLAALAEPLGPLDGSLQADLSVSGTLAAPDVSGAALLTASEAELPELGVTVRDLRLAAEPVGEGVLRLTGSARSGGGTLALEGVAPLTPSEETPVRLQVQGSEFRAVDTQALRAQVTPDLEVRYDGALLAVTGEVRVPEARITTDEGEEAPAAVEPSADVVFVGQEARDEAPDGEEMRFAARVRVVLGDDVTFEGSGLETGLGGSLLVVQEPGAPLRATGELRLEEGTFQAYGQDLRIEHGRLVFAGGPVTNPGIDLRAFREARDGTVAGLEARGTLERPEVTIWSEPAMSQTEALSYLLLGRPVGQASPEEGEMLANAAGSLGVRGGNLLVERLAARFGLEEARIETEGTYEEAQLVLGTYLSPRLYVSYGVGLFEAVNTLRIQYLLSSRFTLRTEVGAGTGADLLYTLERGRGEAVEPPEPVGPEDLDEPPELPPAPPEPER
ncbi:MAG: translocation/assembly module TamB domain-containing protein, partial [Thermoanaerobaculia bacterium]